VAGTGSVKKEESDNRLDQDFFPEGRPGAKITVGTT
jgi:hypothetical protein